MKWLFLYLPALSAKEKNFSTARMVALFWHVLKIESSAIDKILGLWYYIASDVKVRKCSRPKEDLNREMEVFLLYPLIIADGYADIRGFDYVLPLTTQFAILYP